MQQKDLFKLVAEKRNAMKPLSEVESNLGFRGWYASQNLPHFDRPGTIQFVTYRLADSLASSQLRELEHRTKFESEPVLRRRMEHWLDRGHGCCHLSHPQVASMIQENLWHHDGKTYQLQAWVIMPNHVHVLFEQWEMPLGRLVKNWKGFTARQANRILGRSGTFWAEDYFDRYVRNEEHYRRLVRYIEGNPQKAHLATAPGDWLWSSGRYRGEPGPIVPVPTHPSSADSRG